MLVQMLDRWTLQFKSKNTEMKVGAELKIGDVVISGPGEFDVAGISVQAIRGESQTIFAILIEDLNICVFPRTPQALSANQLEQVGAVDVAVVPVVKDQPISLAMTLINSLEPRMVMVIGDGDVATLKGLVQLDESVFKLTKAVLPEEDRQIISLPLK